MENVIIAIVLSIILVTVGILYIRTLTLEEIRESVYRAFLVAESSFKHGENEEKLEYAVNAAKEALMIVPVPTPIKMLIIPLITTENLRKIVDAWFKQVKILVQQIPTDKVTEEK